MRKDKPRNSFKDSILMHFTIANGTKHPCSRLLNHISTSMLLKGSVEQINEEEKKNRTTYKKDGTRYK